MSQFYYSIAFIPSRQYYLLNLLLPVQMKDSKRMGWYIYLWWWTLNCEFVDFFYSRQTSQELISILFKYITSSMLYWSATSSDTKYMLMQTTSSKQGFQANLQSKPIHEAICNTICVLPLLVNSTSHPCCVRSPHSAIYLSLIHIWRCRRRLRCRSRWSPYH